jgi:hypothetical protein
MDFVLKMFKVYGERSWDFSHARLYVWKSDEHFVASNSADFLFYYKKRRNGVLFAIASWWAINSESRACQG